ncbi:ets-related transcription factor elf-2 [Limosa lapponica baueri]|uniref:Ets-related transcription factor elf-2 n=1 Tax=Limosa lapponica baueri TaxID=1758121 RepID=A0A2I0TP74_LIMLA|nr:ets-related transcription factor elf-2 [Limosa lapponica baueri]
MVTDKQENEPVSEFPAVIVEPVPSARLEQGYAAQVLVYDDETYLMQDVAEEQEIETETVETGEGKRYRAVGRKQFDVGEVVKGAVVNVNEKAG